MFTPRFSIAPGVPLRAVFRPLRLEATFTPPSVSKTPSTVVRQVYPSGDLVPANLLKFYVEFSEPMSRGQAWQHLKLLDQAGVQIQLPFLEIDQELWDREGKRLTILFDPGRIKRGVLPREEIGASLEAGKQYTLVVDSGWLDGRGTPLAKGFEKRFRVGPEDRSAIEPSAWEVRVPKAGTQEPLIVEFGETLDSALAARLISVAGVAGTVALDRNESVWRFVPEQPWTADDHKITIETTLEDLAGNRVGRAFDVDVFLPVTERIVAKSVSLPFQTR